MKTSFGVFLVLLAMLGYLVFQSLPKRNSSMTPGTWTEEIRNWNGGRILIVSYPDPILGEQRHIIPYTPSPWEP